MHHFFIPASLFQSGEIVLPAEVSRQICRVLRLKTGSEILLLDDLGFEYPSRLSEINETRCTAAVQSKQLSQGEPSTRLTLVIGITQREKFELILQKCTEIGVSEIIPFISSRTLVQKSGEIEDKYPRWNRILQEAAEQSHRGKIPQLLPAIKYGEVLNSMKENDALKLVLWEEESEISLKSILQGCKSKEVCLVIGPEGGLSTKEVEAAKEHGFTLVTLGKRILRMETAAMIATGLVIYELG
jgi:16S rRNA (uracil1498-N3)-methyltransferase